MAWRQVSADEARQHKYYGLHGWLLLVYVDVCMSVALSLLFFSILLRSAVISAWEPMSVPGPILTGLILILFLPFVILAPIKHRLMPTISIWCMWAYGALNAVTLTYAANDVSILIGGWFAGALVAAPWQWYVTASKRVNVTYRHRVWDESVR